MPRRSAYWLCGVTLLLGIALGSLTDLWKPSAVNANALDPATADQLYKELRAGDSALQGASELMAKVARLATPSVVHIQSEKRTRRGTVEETGSGAIVEMGRLPGQFIVSNRHVVDGAELKDISIHLHDGRVIHPTKVITDKATDVAVLKVSAENLQPARWGDSKELKIGHVVLAMGSPFGLSQSVTFGIISAIGRRSLDLGSGSEVYNQDFLQTDAAINPGNSGGPLINLKGEIIGINTAIASNSGGNEGIGFSIPSNLVKRVAEQLIEQGKVTRAYLGVKLDPQFNATTASRLKLERVRGARIIEVYPDTPAARAKLQFDDVVLFIDDTEVQDENHLINVISLMPVSKQVKLNVMRGGKRISITVVVGDRVELEQRAEAPTQPGMGISVEPLGLTLHRLDRETSKQLGFPETTSGLLVLKVDPQGPSADDVQIYDLIEEAARVPVGSVEELQSVLDGTDGENLLLKVRRSQGGTSESRVVILPR